MAGKPEMKVKATMDNSDLKKKSRESKDALRDFEKAGTDAVGRLGEAFGVNTGKIDQMLSSVRGLGLQLQESGNAGQKAFGKILAGIDGASAALAGLGLASAVAVFEALSAEAENFKNTVAGANLELQTTAYIDTYRQVIHDFNRDLGKGFAETESGWKKFWGTIGSTMKAYLTSGAAFQSALPGASTVVMPAANTQQLDRYLKVTSEARENAATAENIFKQIYDVQRQISDSSVEWARMEREIAEYKRIAYDKTVDSTTQLEALERSVKLINKRYGEEAELKRALADLQFEYNSLAESSVADIDKANQLRIQEEAVVARMNNALRELSDRQATVTQNAEEEAKARAEALAAAQKMAQSRADLAAWGQMASQVSLINAPKASVSGISVPITPTLDESEVIDLTNELQSMVSSSFETIGIAIGELVGDLATGGDAWSNFTNTAISAFGDMAIAVGKMAVSTGTTTLGIKAALESLNGYVAIAAGTALIALGAAVKAGLSNIANGGYSASSSVASSTGSYGSSSIGTAFDEREINVKISGKLIGDGSQLLGVIESENQRKNHTT